MVGPVIAVPTGGCAARGRRRWSSGRVCPVGTLGIGNHGVGKVV